MPIHLLIQLAKDYQSEKNMTKESFDLYDTILKQYTDFFVTNNIEFAKTIDVILYIDSLKERGYSVSWINLQLTAIKGLYRYLSDNQILYGLSIEYAFIQHIQIAFLIHFHNAIDTIRMGLKILEQY